MEQFDSMEEGGWIGSWSPGIGDPTLVGWLTVVLYFLTAWCAYRVATKRAFLLSKTELWFWRMLALGLAALGVNKQLDLQTALTEFGRILAAEQGWYDERRQVQRTFIVTVALGNLLLGSVVAVLLRSAPRPTWLAIAGTIGLLCFVAIRAASFHHLDAWLGGSIDGLHWNWILEVGSIVVVLMGTLGRFSSTRKPEVRVLRQTSR